MPQHDFTIPQTNPFNASDDQDPCQEQLLEILSLLNTIDEDLRKKSGRKGRTKLRRETRANSTTTDNEEVKSPRKYMRKRHSKPSPSDCHYKKGDNSTRNNSLIPHHRKVDKIHLNVGGRRFVVDQSTLLRVPNSRLYKLAENHFSNGTDLAPTGGSSTCPEFSILSSAAAAVDTYTHAPYSSCNCRHDDCCGQQYEYFFDRHPDAFEMILSYYRTGQLHCPINMCGPMFHEELQFWGIDDKRMETCCWTNYRTYHNAEKTFASLVKDESTDESDEEEKEEGQATQNKSEIAQTVGSGNSLHSKKANANQSHWTHIGRVFQEAFEKTDNRRPISIGLAVVSIIIRIISVVLMALQTLATFRVKDRAFVILTVNYTFEILSDEGRMVSEFLNSTDPHPWITLCEIVIVIYFLFELIWRFALTKSKLKFISKSLNWLDLLAVLCSIAGVLVDLYHVRSSKNLWIQLLHIPKIFRLFRLTRFMSGLRILLYTARASMRELFLMVVIFFIFVIFFGTAMFLAEQLLDPKDNQLQTLPHAYWWALVTMTTLGYGDIVPKTAPGYVVGIMCAVNGVLVIALPVPIVINNFALFYSHEVARRSMPRDRRRQLYRQINDRHQNHDSYKVLMLSKYTAPAVSSTSQLAGSAVNL